MVSYGLPAWSYPAAIGGILVITGAGEYLRIAPPGTFSSMLLVALGLIAPSPAFPHPAATVITPQATVEASGTTNVTDSVR